MTIDAEYSSKAMTHDEYKLASSDNEKSQGRDGILYIHLLWYSNAVYSSKGAIIVGDGYCYHYTHRVYCLPTGILETHN